MPTPARTGNGYRTYDDRDVARIEFIRAAQAAGLSLVDIRSVFDMRDHGRAPCRHVALLIDDRLVDVRRAVSISRGESVAVASVAWLVPVFDHQGRVGVPC